MIIKIRTMTMLLTSILQHLSHYDDNNSNNDTFDTSNK